MRGPHFHKAELSAWKTRKPIAFRRAARYARGGANAGGVAARIAGARLFGGGGAGSHAAALAQALGGLKGPMMKVAQTMASAPTPPCRVSGTEVR
jgi:hypothetical protein